MLKVIFYYFLTIFFLKKWLGLPLTLLLWTNQKNQETMSKMDDQSPIYKHMLGSKDLGFMYLES